MTIPVEFSHDTEHDLAYLRVGEPRPVARTQEVEVSGTTVVIDLDTDGKIAGFEFLHATPVLPVGGPPAAG